MKILLTTASRHGATAAVGEWIATELERHGHEVLRFETTWDGDLPDEPFDAAVVGGATYGDEWLEAAQLTQDHLLERGVPTFAFAVGALGITPDPTASRWTAARTADNADERVKFGGVVDRAHWTGPENSVLDAFHIPEGEQTDWEAVRTWAGAVAAGLGGAHDE